MTRFIRRSQSRGKQMCAVLCLPLTMGLSGCGSLGVDSSLGAAQVRFVQVAAGGPEMDFYVNGTGAAYSLGFASFTSYLPVSPGAATLGVTKAGGTQAVGQTQSTLAGAHQYTAVVSHGLGNLQERVYADQETPASQEQVALRVINAVETPAAVSFYVVPASNGASPAAPAAVFSLGSGSASGYVDLPAGGAYTVTATIAEGALNLPVGSVSLKASSGAVRTVVFAGKAQPGGHGVVGFALEDVNTP